MAHSARTERETAHLRTGLGCVRRNAEPFERALKVQHEEPLRGCHHTSLLSDLLMAATAEQNGLTVPHCDGDSYTTAEITGRWARRVAEPAR
ncbi:hypothetical protein SUDANB106_03414 [Streptomyces sp. enrichment culture]|uniref:hypothetical protein n=1 Tax=Streptomyces sp. enrichment culture TaxID=1795815 RepID=UPI003F5628A5